MDDWIQQKIRQPYENGVFSAAGMNMNILHPYFSWKLGGGKFPTRDELLAIRKYTSAVIAEEILEESVMDLVYVIDDELDNIFIIKYA